LGGAWQSSLALLPTLDPTLALHPPKLCEHLNRGELYRCNEIFRMQIVAEYSANVALDRASITLKLPEL